MQPPPPPQEGHHHHQQQQQSEKMLLSQDEPLLMSSSPQQQQQTATFTSTTAPGKVFGSRAELAAHYQTAWHRYNLKRREASLPVLLEADFNARWAAAQAVHTERQHGGNKNNTTNGGTNGTDHLKHGKKGRRNNNSKSEHQQSTPVVVEMKEEKEGTTAADVVVNSSSGDGSEEPQQQTTPTRTTTTTTIDVDVEIDPRQCLFDRHISMSVESNVQRMHRKYGFFIPDREYLVDMEGLIGYCHEKIQLGRVCLYCHRTFRTSWSCQQHMKSKIHTKLRYEMGIDLEDIDVFYDFTDADAEFWNSTKVSKPLLEAPKVSTVSDDDDDGDAEGEDDDDEEEDGWEDISDDEDGVDNDDDDDDDNDMVDMDEDEKDMYRGYEEEVARMGFNVTALGELIFPDGRIVGHRGLRRYYKQRLPNRGDSNPAVAAARQAAGERLYRGRVYQIGNGTQQQRGSSSAADEDSKNNYALVMAGIAPGIAAGRAGRGILVPTNGSGTSTYSQVSIYRYRAAIQKQRRGERAGQLIHHRTATNMNRMDKKANRLMNNVSVAHAQR